MSTDELQKSVENWKRIVEENAFADSVGALATSIVSSSPILDRLSTWVMAGSAGVAGLAITNIDKMTAVYSDSDVKWLFVALAASIFFGVVQKFLAVMCASSLNASHEVAARFAKVLEIYQGHEAQIAEISQAHDLGIKAELDIVKVLKTFIGLYPKWFLWIFKKHFEKAFSDRIYAYKFLVRVAISQGNMAFLQCVAILSFVVMAASFV